MERDWATAREKVLAERACRVCGATGDLDPAHIIARSLGGHEDPDNIVPLCRHCHTLFDHGRLNLLPFLTVEEQVRAVQLAGSIARAAKLLGHVWEEQ